MVIMFYVLGATLAAWLTMENGQWDWRLSILVLPLMFVAHLCCRGVGRKRTVAVAQSTSDRSCLVCNERIGLFQRMVRHHRFCSESHEREYLAELEALAVQRLRGACADATPAATYMVKSALAAKPVAAEEDTLSLIVRPKATAVPACGPWM